MYGRNRGGGGGGRGGRGRLGGGNFRGNGGWKQPRESGENIQGQRAHHIIQSHSKNEFAKKKRELHKRATVNHFSSIIQHIEVSGLCFNWGGLKYIIANKRFLFYFLQTYQLSDIFR